MHIHEEAARCLLCADAPCSKACKHSDPARAIRAVRFGNEAIARQWVAQADEAELEAAEKACTHDRRYTTDNRGFVVIESLGRTVFFGFVD